MLQHKQRAARGSRCRFRLARGCDEVEAFVAAAREHEEEFVNVIRPSGNVELGRSSLDVRVPYAATRGGRGMIAQFPRESEKKKPCL